MATDKVQFDILVNASPAEKALNKFARTVDKTVGKVSKKLLAMEKSFDNIAKSIKAIDKNDSFKGLSKDLGRSNKELKEMERRLKNINRLQRQQGGGMSSGSRSGGRSRGANRLISGGVGLLGGLGAYGLMGLIQGIPEAGIKFESTMTDISGILSRKPDGGGFDGLEEKIRSIGKTSAFTMNEMAGAAKFMAMAGMGGTDISGSLGAVSSLGMVGGMSVERSADIITNIMTSMGIDPTKDSSNVADIITATMTGANVSIEEIGQSMAYTGNIAAMTGTSIQETAAAIGILGDNGIKASRAGTNLRQMFLKLANPSKKGRETIEALQLSLYEIGKNGKRQLKPLANILEQFKKSGAGVTEFENIFGVRGGQAFGALVSGAEKYKKLLKDMGVSGGLTENLAEKKRNTTAGKIFILKSVWEDFSITLMDKVRPAFNYVLDGLTKLIEKLSKNEGFLNMVENAANGLAKAIRIAYEVTKFLFKFITDNGELVLTVLAGIGTAMGLLAIKSAAVALINPFTAWIAAGAGVLFILDKIMETLPATEDQSRGSMGEKALARQYRKELSSRGWGIIGQSFSGTGVNLESLKWGRKVQKMGAGGLAASSDSDVISFYQKHFMTRYERAKFMEEQRDAAAQGKSRNKSEQIKKELTQYLKDFVAPKGSDMEKTLTKIGEIISSTDVNLGLLKTSSNTKEGDGFDTLASPLTSQANEMSRSIVVNFNADSALAKIEVGSGSAITDEQVKSDIEQQMSEVFLKVVSDFELGMSH